MALTVRQLIEKLQAMDQSSKIALVNHDQSPENGEMDGLVECVQEAPDALKERGASVYIR